MLFLRLDQALQLLRATKSLKERLVVRYMVFNGLSPMEISAARIEHLDPVERTLFLPKRHWKRNCVCDIDSETVRLQIIYSEARKKGPLIRSQKRGHFTRQGIYNMVKTVARRTSIPDAEKVSPIVLKRTFAREWLLSGGTISSLQKQFSHRGGDTPRINRERFGGAPMTETHLVQFNCPKKLLEDFDETLKRIGRYRDRTHALLVAMEFFIEENKCSTTASSGTVIWRNP